MGKQIYEVTATRIFLSDKKLSIQEVQNFFDNNEKHSGWAVDAMKWTGESVDRPELKEAPHEH